MSKNAKTVTNLVLLAILLVVLWYMLTPLMTEVVVPKWFKDPYTKVVE